MSKKMQEGKSDQEEAEDHVFISGIGGLLSAFCKPLRKSLKIIQSLSTHTNGKVGEIWVFHIKAVLQHSPLTIRETEDFSNAKETPLGGNKNKGSIQLGSSLKLLSSK